MCLLAAALLGFVIGWMLRQLGFGGKLEELETSWKSRLAGVEGERDKLRIHEAELTAHSRKLESEWVAKYAGLSADHEKMKGSLADCEQKCASLDADRKTKLASLDAEMKKLAAEQETKFSAAAQDLNAWKLKFDELERTAGEAKAGHDSLNARLAAGAAALAAAEAARIALGNDSKKLAAELEAEKLKQSNSDADWKSKWAMRDNELVSWKAKFANVEKSSAGLKAEQDSLNAKLAAGSAALAAAEATRQSLTNDSKKLAAQLEEVQARNSRLDADWRAKWAALEKERDQLKADIELKAKQGQDVRDHEEHDKLAAAEANWKSRWVALEKERDNLKSQLDAGGRNTLLSGENDGAARIATLEAELDKFRKG